jgi:hypothetical protein
MIVPCRQASRGARLGARATGSTTFALRHSRGRAAEAQRIARIAAPRCRNLAFARSGVPSAPRLLRRMPCRQPGAPRKMITDPHPKSRRINIHPGGTDPSFGNWLWNALSGSREPMNVSTNPSAKATAANLAETARGAVESLRNTAQDVTKQGQEALSQAGAAATEIADSASRHWTRILQTGRLRWRVESPLGMQNSCRWQTPCTNGWAGRTAGLARSPSNARSWHLI